MKEACLYKPLKNNSVSCNLCMHTCMIKDGSRGICNVRQNNGGILETLVYGKLIAEHIDPIEKKPLFHFLPGSLSYSIASVGCNFKCLFCQNADIAQMPSDHEGLIIGEPRSPEQIVNKAIKGNCKSISYTYTEPVVNFEFVYDTAKLAHAKGLKNVLVTNGYMTPEALDMIRPYLDAANVDLKAFNADFYTKICRAKLEHVKDTLIRMKSAGIFLEVTTLIIPELNDSVDEIKALALFLVEAIGTETPWHISRFYPTYKLTHSPPTPVKKIFDARQIGIKSGLKYVYAGNVHGNGGENTCCYSCGKILIERSGFYVTSNCLVNRTCPDCGVDIDVIL